MSVVSCKIPIKSLKSGKFVYKQITRLASTNSENTGRESSLATPVHEPTKTDLEVPPASLREANADKDPGALPDDSSGALIFDGQSCKLTFTYATKTSTKCEQFHEQNRPVGSGQVTLECLDITAADLRVTSKFGSWDTMVGRIIIECRSPVRACTRYNTPTGALIEGAPMNCRMVKATFPVEYLQQARDMLHALKLTRNLQLRRWKEKSHQGQGESPAICPPGKIREGLPEWVNYIPYRWYSCRLRRVIEYLLVLYTILSLLWALWQLYKHVDFVKAYLRPVLDFLEYYLSIFKSWLAWLDQFTTLMSQYWWRYMKPFYIIFVTAMAPVIQLFAPLKSIINLIPRLLDPFFQLFHIMYTFVQPLVTPVYSLVDILFIRGFKVIFSSILLVFQSFINNPLTKFIIEKGSQTYFVRVITEILHGKLDPIKAQVVVIRDLIFKSIKSIYFGGKFISSRIYYMVVFVKREQEYIQEEEMVKPPGKTPESTENNECNNPDTKVKSD